MVFLLMATSWLLGAASCKKTGEFLTVNESASFSASLQASVDSVTLAPANDSANVLTFTWPAVSYGSSSVAVTYTLEMDVPSDTAGSSGWAKAQQFVAGNNVLTYTFSGQILNNVMQTLNIFSDSAMVFRVMATVNQYNGSASTVPATYTPAVSVSVTPYTTNLFVPGAYQNWNPATAPVLNPVPGRPGMFEGYVDITGSGIQYFKYTNAPDWNHTNYGDGGVGRLARTEPPRVFPVPGGGYYKPTANLNTNTWTATLTNWGIIGDATPGGWNTDTQMTYDAVNQVWTVTAPMVSSGSFKFRANDAWVIDFGINNAGQIEYADNPFFGYTAGLNNLTVSANGTYLITLDLHISQHYSYSAVLQ